ncbi:CLUMA_CG005253, isoform A [Clunio marinus]|uniref:CLUMA_CG005253, isoform A n=1 Tax=Clunio marinus TaxID=568069 RepID=A0A1J1HU51_9DIPT|nr:CLUMA_CG005253, isoform A [Clunio marinus]
MQSLHLNEINHFISDFEDSESNVKFKRKVEMLMMMSAELVQLMVIDEVSFFPILVVSEVSLCQCRLRMTSWHDF